jgi:ketosteroid isomerase-like protein
MSQWVEAYQHFDAKRVAALEAPDVEIVDRFGQPHLLTSRDENEHLWSDAFETVSRKYCAPINND